MPVVRKWALLPMSGTAATDSGNLVVDMVCDVCRIQGFSVEKNVQANAETPLLIDIVASRKKRSKTQRVAFECWEGYGQVNAREIENFVQRLKTLGLTSGIYVSPKGFTGNAEFIARKLGVELWDLAKLKDRLYKIKPPERARVPGTLPVQRSVSSRIFPHHLENGNVLRIASLPKLEFRPYYFVTFAAKGGRKKTGKGVLVLDGVDGRPCDAALLEGHIEHLPSTGLFVECLDIEPSVGSMPKLPPELEMKNNVTIAPAGVAPEKVAGIVPGTLQGEVGINPENVTVIELSLLHVPIVTVELTAVGRSYRKILQAATGRIIWDDTFKCSFCADPSKSLCEVCGETSCPKHAKLCTSCKKHLCTNCVTSKGVLGKQLLCPACKKS